MCVWLFLDRYDESLWKGALDLSGKTLRKDCVKHLLDRGVSVVRLARAEVDLSFIRTFQSNLIQATAKNRTL